MTLSPEHVRTLVARCEQFRESRAPQGYRDGLALCIVDSVQSTGVTYSSVVNVVNGYRRYRRQQGGNPETDGAVELSATFGELGGPDGWAREIGNQNKTSTRVGAPLKSLAIQEAAKVLAELDVNTTHDLRNAAEDPQRLTDVEAAWLRVPGQGSGITWHYVQMLAGIPGIKPNRMITRFIADAPGLPRKSVKPHFALEALMATAHEMDLSPTDLDHGIWQWQRRH